MKKWIKILSIILAFIVISFISICLIQFYNTNYGPHRIMVDNFNQNVDMIRARCSSACSVKDEFVYCKIPFYLMTNDQSKKIYDVTCFYLATNKPEYGIEECKAINCNQIVKIIPNTNFTIKDESSLTKECKEKVDDFVIQTLIFNETNKKNILISHTCNSSDIN